MKNILLLLAFVLSIQATAQVINFPDANFKASLIAIGVDTNNDGDITQAEALVPTTLNLSNQNIADATGIEFFTSLTRLRFNGNNLTSINVSSNTALTFLTLSGNPITALNLFDNTALESLYIADCTSLSSLTLPSSAPNLGLISGRNNALLTNINLAPYTGLQSFVLLDGGLTSLNVSSNTALRILNVPRNALTSLDLSSNSAIQNLFCEGNNLTSLIIANSSNLTNITCHENALTSLDFSSATSLGSLNCTDNNLLSLNIKNGNNTSLGQMYANNNPNLVCIQVDDAAAADAKVDWIKDAFTTYSDTNPCSPFINFPDANMKAAVIANPGIDLNGDGEVQYNEAARVTSLGLLNASISDATGIEYFTSLTNLTISRNPALNTLDVSALSLLEVLDASFNSLTSTNFILPTTSTILTLKVNDNNLTALDVSGFTNLEYLQCYNNGITSLNITSGSIIQVIASANPFTSFNVPATSTLTRLYLAGARFTNLDVSSNTGLQELDLDFSRVTSLDLSSNTNLTFFRAGSGNLEELNLSNLTNTTLVNVSGNTNLSCIRVSDVAVANANTNWTKDATASYALSCGPSVTINNAPASTSAPFTVTFNIDRDVTGFTASDVVLTNASISGFTATSGPDEYEALITPTSICSTNITIDVPANVMIDASNASNSAATTVTVATIDNIDPVATGQDITIQLDASGQASITGNDIDNGSTDNCAIASLTASKTNFDCTELGVNQVTLTVTDTSGNTNTATVAVTVEDAQDPTVSAQNITVQLAANNQVTITPADVNTGLTDNCSAVLSLSQSTFDCTNLGANTVTLTATDPSGNTATATATVTVEQDPNQALTAITQNITVQLDANGSVTIAPTDVDDGSGSGCSSNPTLSLDITSFDCTNLGANTVTLTASEGNATSTATATVTVEDNIDPVATGQDITVQLDASGQASITGNDIDNGSTDNCAIASLTVSKTNFDCTELGVNQVTLTVTDTSGNTNTATVAVTVEDAQDPTVSAQNITVQLAANNQVTITPADVSTGFSDNCSVVLSLSQSTFDCTNLGANTVTLTATDPSGNTATATATVTVEQDPNQALTAITQNITVQLDANGSVTIAPTDVDDGSGSGCSSNPTLSLDITSFDCTNLGANTVTLTASEGNATSTATATVTVEDNIDPVATGQDITVQLDASGQASITGNDIDNGSTDNCAIASLTVSKTNFDCTELGVNQVTLTVTDTSGNTNTATVAVTVEDAQDPTVSAQNITVQLAANNQVTITPADVSTGFSDNCSVVLSLSQSTFDCTNLGANTVTLTATDPSGNTATATATITVEQDPNQALTAITQNITVQLDANGSVTITPADVDDGSGSGCSSNPTLSLDITSFDCTNLGANTVTLTASEGSNTSTATATVTVEDDLGPNIVVQDINVDLDANNTAAITIADINNGTTDNCSADANITFSLDVTSFSCNDLGSNTVTLTATDTNGNTSTETATVTVRDVTAPTVVTQDITVQLDTDGQATISAQDIDNGSTDSCSGIATMSLDTSSFNCPMLGDVTVTLTVTDNSGNTANATAIVTITGPDEDNDGISDACDSKEIIFSKGFSPNGDGQKDTWVIENIDNYPKNKVTVFNRWGEKVYQATNYNNDWNGKSNQRGGSSETLPVGSYLYIINLNEPDFAPIKGWIYINY